MSTTSVGRLVVEALAAEGVTHAFTVPGESFLGVLDAFNDKPAPAIVTAHHEEGAGFMAQAMAQVSDRPGAVLVTRGPGVTHLSIALHTAMQDSVPLVAIVGQVTGDDIGREAFQEIDLLAFGRVLCKAALEIREPRRAAEVISRALYLAQAGRPGPVLVSVPENVANATGVEYVHASRQRIPRPHPSSEAIAQLCDLVTGAASVAIVVGSGVLRASATTDVVRLAEALDATVYTGFRRFDAFPNDHRCYAGNLPWLPESVLEPLRTADVVLALGTRLGDFTSLHYRVPAPTQTLVQVDLDAAAMSVVRTPDLAIVADVGVVVRELLAKLTDTMPEFGGTRRVATTAAHEAYWLSSTVKSTASDNAWVDLDAAIGILGQVLPSHAAITSDAGAFSAYLNRYYRWTHPKTFYGTASGAMGYAVPAAIGVKLADPGRPVLAVAGDGGFAMTMSEIHTAVRLGLEQLVILIFDNGTYGTIRLHQQRAFEGREIAVDQGRADLAAVARGLGATAFRVPETADLGEALREALAAPGPAVVHALTDPDQLSAWP